MLFEREPSPAVRKVLDACLILHAEHTMNASTFSGRVTGSTLANPYTVISAAIGTLTGPLHGGANEEVLDMLDEIGSVENVRAWLRGRVADQEEDHGLRPSRLQGEGPAGDGAAGAGRARLRRDRAGRRCTTWRSSWSGWRPSRFSGPRASTRTSISTPASSTRRSASRATCSRRSSPSPASPAGWRTGWSSCKNNRIYPPEQIYVGKHDAAYVPLEKRP